MSSSLLRAEGEVYQVWEDAKVNMKRVQYGKCARKGLLELS
jgi:hypothetical protein